MCLKYVDSVVNWEALMVCVDVDPSPLLIGQFKDASTVLHKTTQQVHKLVRIVGKASPAAPQLRSSIQPPHLGESTHTKGAMKRQRKRNQIP